MSSDYLTSTKAFADAQPQGLQPSSSTREPALAGTDAKRNESATSGQLLPPGQTDEAVDKTRLESAVRKISDFVQNFQRDLKFSVDDASGRTVINVVDSQTKQVIRQIPSEQSLRIAEQMDSPESLIFSEQA